MEQRPPILQWKVALALFAVVGIAVTLGSALHSSPRTFSIEIKQYAVSTLRRETPVVIPMITTPVGPNLTSCQALKAALRKMPPAETPTLRMLLRRTCQKHH